MLGFISDTLEQSLSKAYEPSSPVVYEDFDRIGIKIIEIAEDVTALVQFVKPLEFITIDIPVMR